jgi:Domain of unknown function DUF11
MSASTGGSPCNTPPVGHTGPATCQLGAISNYSTKTLSFTVLVTAKKVTITSTANGSVGPLSSDPNSANNSATVDIRVKQQPDLPVSLELCRRNCRWATSFYDEFGGAGRSDLIRSAA